MNVYIPNAQKEKDYMMSAIGISKMDDLFVEIPEALRLKNGLNLPDGMSEFDVINDLKQLAQMNIGTNSHTCFLGGGAYDTFIPSAVPHLVSRSEFYTAYTPYQPEISQGTLQAIFEFQTMICELTGMDTANASMYDGATACAEAAMMASAANPKATKIVVSETVNPQYREVLSSYMKNKNLELVTIPSKNGITDLDALKEATDSTVAGVIIQNPNFFGYVEDAATVNEIAKASKSLFIYTIGDAQSLAIMKTPGEFGADIAVGEGQCLGNVLGYGGPYLGFMAANSKQIRKLPGRIVGQTKDADGKRAFVLTLQAREQHIRREKATSNICSNQALNALVATIYLSLIGKKGFKNTAQQSASKLRYLVDQLNQIGVKPCFSGSYFREIPVCIGKDVTQVNEALLKRGFIGGLDLSKHYANMDGSMLICVTEKRTKSEIDAFVAALAEILEVMA